MSSVEFEGKNVDKAVEMASVELNMAADDLDYEILSRGSSGIFGLAGVKKARIRVNLPETNLEFGPEQDSENLDNTALTDRTPAATSEADDDNSAESLQRSAGSEEDPVDLARDVLQRIIDAITSGATISAEETSDRILLNVAGGNAGALIGKKGQTLEAIQSLVDKIVNKRNNRHDRIRVQVDVEGYLATRRLNLEKLAMRLADKSKKIRKPISLGQMNGYDRRIVHLALKDDPGVQTKSRGEGYMRKLVIFPRKNRAHSQPSQ
jgi:spoIIIJ-associated protein